MKNVKYEHNKLGKGKILRTTLHDTCIYHFLFIKLMVLELSPFRCCTSFLFEPVSVKTGLYDIEMKIQIIAL